METKTAWGRLVMSMAATVIVATLILATPLRHYFFFLCKFTHEKVAFAVPFYGITCICLFAAEIHVRRSNAWVVALLAAIAGVAISFIILEVQVVQDRYATGRMSTVLRDVVDATIPIIAVCVVRGTFLITALVAICYRYMPAWQGWIRKSMKRR